MSSVYQRSSVSAFIILNRKGTHVATVHVMRGSGGGVQADVLNHGDGPCVRSLETAIKTGHITEKKLSWWIDRAPDYYTTEKSRREWAAYQLFGSQTSKAGGYGYDKNAAALSGLIVDGHTLANHCGSVPEDEKKRANLMRRYEKSGDFGNEEWREKAAKIGARWANWRDGKWSSLHFDTGLDRLQTFGYRVLQAI